MKHPTVQNCLECKTILRILTEVLTKYYKGDTVGTGTNMQVMPLSDDGGFQEVKLHLFLSLSHYIDGRFSRQLISYLFKKCVGLLVQMFHSNLNNPFVVLISI